MPISGSSATAPKVSTDNSTTTPLADAAVYTGTWEDVTAFESVVISVSTDQNGVFSVQFSPDGVNQDSTLTRYYRTDRINAPHRFTITRAYCRIVFTNNSGSAQTYLRLQTSFGSMVDLNVPLDSTVAQDYDATAVRPTLYVNEVTLGLRQGHTTWNKFGYNDDVDTAAPEVMASWGGTFVPMTTARTLSIVSTSSDDDSAGDGARTIQVTGVDENRIAQSITVTLDGLTPVVTTESWLGINRLAVASSGTDGVNAGAITATATTDATIQGQIPAGEGTTQQCIFFTQAGHMSLFKWLTVGGARFGSGTEPTVTFKGWVYSAISDGKYEVVRILLDLGVESHIELTPPVPFPVGEQSCFWLEATTTRNDTSVSGRFSLIDVRDADA